MVCSIQDDLLFILKPSVDSYYTLVTNSTLVTKVVAVDGDSSQNAWLL